MNDGEAISDAQQHVVSGSARADDIHGYLVQRVTRCYLPTQLVEQLSRLPLFVASATAEVPPRVDQDEIIRAHGGIMPPTSTAVGAFLWLPLLTVNEVVRWHVNRPISVATRKGNFHDVDRCNGGTVIGGAPRQDLGLLV